MLSEHVCVGGRKRGLSQNGERNWGEGNNCGEKEGCGEMSEGGSSEEVFVGVMEGGGMMDNRRLYFNVPHRGSM